MLKRQFNIKKLENILQKVLEEPSCSLSSLYSGCNEETRTLHLYFVCECIEPFLLKHVSYFCELFCSNHFFLKPDLLPYCQEPFRFHELVISLEICYKNVQLQRAFSKSNIFLKWFCFVRVKQICNLMYVVSNTN